MAYGYTEVNKIIGLLVWTVANVNTFLKGLKFGIIKYGNHRHNLVHIYLHLTASIAPVTASEPERAATPSYPMSPRSDDEAPPTPGKGFTAITNFFTFSLHEPP